MSHTKTDEVRLFSLLLNERLLLDLDCGNLEGNWVYII